MNENNLLPVKHFLNDFVNVSRCARLSADFRSYLDNCKPRDQKYSEIVVATVNNSDDTRILKLAPNYVDVGMSSFVTHLIERIVRNLKEVRAKKTRCDLYEHEIEIYVLEFHLPTYV